MSTGCQKVSQTDSAPGIQSDRMTVWQNSRAGKEPALVSKGVIFIPCPPPCDFAIDVAPHSHIGEICDQAFACSSNGTLCNNFPNLIQNISVLSEEAFPIQDSIWQCHVSNVIGLPVLVNKILSWFSLPYNFHSFSPQGKVVKKSPIIWGRRKPTRFLE